MEHTGLILVVLVIGIVLGYGVNSLLRTLRKEKKESHSYGGGAAGEVKPQSGNENQIT